MKMKYYLAVFFLCAGTVVFGQLNEYKYIIVPRHFEAFKKPNQHLTSTLIKHLFTNAGFNATYDEPIPMELRINPCDGLTVDLIDKSNAFTTRVNLILKNCRGEIIFETPEARSKEKDFKDSYEDAITESFEPLANMGYSYSPGDKEEPVTVRMDKDIKRLPAPAEEVEKAKQEIVKKETAEAVEAMQEAIPERTDIQVPTPQKKPESPVAVGDSDQDLWYAQPISNGYQLVDSTPKVRLKLLQTSRDGEYVAIDNDGNQGVVYQKEGKWWYERYTDGNLISEEIHIKF